MDNFGIVYDKMNENYNEVIDIMGKIYDKNESVDSNEILQILGHIADKMLFSQMLLTEVYCDPEYQKQIIENLSEKKAQLKHSLEETSSTGRTR